VAKNRFSQAALWTKPLIFLIYLMAHGPWASGLSHFLNCLFLSSLLFSSPTGHHPVPHRSVRGNPNPNLMKCMPARL
jgi:hypothetical protein